MKNIERAILDTCKGMIDSVGVHSISVRKLVEASGCSLRSLYNNFENLGCVYKSLIDEFTDDIAAFILSGISKAVENDDDLHAVHELFVSYFLRHPNRFYFMYLYKHEKVGSEKNLFETVEFQEKIQRSFDYLLKDRRLQGRDVQLLRRNILYGAFGILVLYFTGNFGLSSNDVLSEFRSFFYAQVTALRSRRRKPSSTSQRQDYEVSGPMDLGSLPRSGNS